MTYTDSMRRSLCIWALATAAGAVGCSPERDARAIEGSGRSGNPVNVGPSVGSGSGALPIGPEHCPEVPDGYLVGEQINEVLPDYELRHCDGGEASLTEVCGAEALFLFSAQGWCSICQNVSVHLEGIQAEYADLGLKTVLVLTEHTDAGTPPDADLCSYWRSESPHEEVLTLYDPNGTLFSLWGGGSSQSAFIDRDRVIRSKLVGVGSLDELRGQIAAVLEVD